MRLHHFFVKEDLSSGNSVSINDSALTHELRNTYRFTVGGQVVLLNDNGLEYHAMITEFKPSSFEVNIISVKESTSIPNTELHVFCPVTEKKKFEWLVEKGTQIGVSRFIPILSQRSKNENLDFDELENIARKSTEFSLRGTIPKIEKLTKFEDAVLSEINLFALSPQEDTFVIERFHNKSPLGVFVGPQDGWSDGEIKMFKDKNISRFSLGNSVLDTETAVIAVSSILLLS